MAEVFSDLPLAELATTRQATKRAEPDAILMIKKEYEQR